MASRQKSVVEDTLFSAAARSRGEGVPLAEKMRPARLEELVGQKHLASGLLARTISEDRLPSIILWGPPGSGKTTIARIISTHTKSFYVPFSAVLGSIGELREIVGAAKERLAYQGQRTILFVDEIHRFNKAQQDAFLPHVEAGTITLIGATTENPSFAVIAALLSRCKVFRLEPLDPEDIVTLLKRALEKVSIDAEPAALRAIAEDARGDARRAITTLEVTAEDARARGISVITEALLAEVHAHQPLLYDKAGEEHYNVTSAFIKSMRGSDPDAAVYWMMRMLEAGDDPLFVARRMIIFASEDVGNADPRAMSVATSADAAFRRLGMPEGIYPLAQCAVYLACTPKSNAVKNAWQAALERVREKGALPVPMKLRNAPTKLMKSEGYGAGYKYPHDHEGHVAEGETYLPDELSGETYYSPTDQGEEARIRQRLERLRKKGV
jgi:putative ATPase